VVTEGNLYMSRIGKTPITIPKDVTVTVEHKEVTVKGVKGQLSFVVPDGISLVQEDGVLTIQQKRNDGKSSALFGFVRAHIANLIKGVSEGWSKTLELVGVGYRAAVTNGNLVLTVGFSHAVTITPPPGISFSVIEGKIIVSGIDKQAVGQIASNVKNVKKPEPYKGKGIRYQGEHVRKKAGKSAKAIGGGTGAK